MLLLPGDAGESLLLENERKKMNLRGSQKEWSELAQRSMMAMSWKSGGGGGGNVPREKSTTSIKLAVSQQSQHRVIGSRESGCRAERGMGSAAAKVWGGLMQRSFRKRGPNH